MTVKDQQVRDILIAVADTLVNHFDVIDFLDMLVTRCVEVLDVTAAGVLLVDHRGTLNLVAASTEQARVLELFQLQNHEGPCLDCFHSGQAVQCANLPAEGQRWPLFTHAAADAGFAAVHALPMRSSDTVIGGLNLFSAQPRTLDADTAALGQALADLATTGILNQRTQRHHELIIEQLETALNSRILIEQAKGIIAERLNTTVETAYIRLRDHARHTRQQLSDVAAAVIHGSADVSAITADVGRPSPE